MSERPWMPMYWGDYVRDTLHLNNAQHGAYLMLIAAYWISGRPLPDNHAELARIARCSPNWWTQNRDCILRFFYRNDTGQWAHKRLEKELVRWNRRSAAASANAQQRARATHNSQDRKKERYTDSENPTLPLEHDNPPCATHTAPHGGNGRGPHQKRGSRLQPDWAPKPKTVAFCKQRFGCSDEKLQEIYEGWMDWGLSTTGPKATKVDWDRAFIGAVRREMRRVQEADERERRRAERYGRH